MTGSDFLKKTITKWTILKAMFHPIVCVAIVSGFTLALLTRNSNPEAATFGLIMSIMCSFVLLPLQIGAVLKDLLIVNRQEKELSLNFNQEMSKNGINFSNYKTKEWFVLTPLTFKTQVVPFNRAYIKEIKDVEERNTGYSSRKWRLRVYMIDGTKCYFHSSNRKDKGKFDDFIAWYKNGNNT